MFWLNGALVAVGTTYTFFTFRQLGAIKQQTEIANKSLQVTQRAFVNVQQIRPIEPVEIGAEIDAIVEYKNSGNTPAKNLWISTGFALVKPSYMPSDMLRTGRSGAIPQLGQILPPNVTRQRSIGVVVPPIFPVGAKNIFPDQKVNMIKAGRLKWVVWVAIDYLDYFGQRHDSVEPFVYDPQTKTFEPSWVGFYQSD